MEINPDLVPLSEAAEAKGVDVRTIRRWVAASAVPSQKIGPIYLVSLKAIMAYQPPPRGRRWPKPESKKAPRKKPGK